jgi:hypothetical protein
VGSRALRSLANPVSEREMRAILVHARRMATGGNTWLLTQLGMLYRSIISAYIRTGYNVTTGTLLVTGATISPLGPYNFSYTQSGNIVNMAIQTINFTGAGNPITISYAQTVYPPVPSITYVLTIQITVAGLVSFGFAVVNQSSYTITCYAANGGAFGAGTAYQIIAFQANYLTLQTQPEFAYVPAVV